jgi:hypothetical protein
MTLDRRAERTRTRWGLIAGCFYLLFSLALSVPVLAGSDASAEGENIVSEAGQPAYRYATLGIASPGIAGLMMCAGLAGLYVCARAGTQREH